MSCTNYEDLKAHLGHKIVCVAYGRKTLRGCERVNIAIECEDCNEVIIDFDKPEGREEK